MRAELQQIEERLSTLPGLEEKLARFQEAGLEDRLREQSLLVREERLLDSIPERLQPFYECLDLLRQALPIDRVFLSSKALQDLPGREILADADEILKHLSSDTEQMMHQLEEVLKRRDEEIADVRFRWNERKREVQSAYEKILRELQQSAVDGAEFIRLRREIEGLRPLRERRYLLRLLENEHLDRRRTLLAEWVDLKAKEFRLLDQAARNVKGAQIPVAAVGKRALRPTAYVARRVGRPQGQGVPAT